MRVPADQHQPRRIGDDVGRIDTRSRPVVGGHPHWFDLRAAGVEQRRSPVRGRVEALGATRGRPADRVVVGRGIDGVVAEEVVLMALAGLIGKHDRIIERDVAERAPHDELRRVALRPSVLRIGSGRRRVGRRRTATAGDDRSRHDDRGRQSADRSRCDERTDRAVGGSLIARVGRGHGSARSTQLAGLSGTVIAARSTFGGMFTAGLAGAVAASGMPSSTGGSGVGADA